MMFNYVIAVYMNFWSWHVHGSHSVYLLKSGVTDHDRALKLLHVIDKRVWQVNFLAIIESRNYETLNMDELFSKVKSIKIDHQT
jgi:hypothetical protein